MKKEHIKIGIALIVTSVFLYVAHYNIFHDMEHLTIFLVSDIAFVPLEVLLVSLILERMIEKQEEEKAFKKLHMLVGMFYQEIGDELLRIFVKADDGIKLNDIWVTIDSNWTKEDYKKLEEIIKSHSHEINVDKIDLKEVYKMLSSRRSLIISFLTNPILLEKDYFSNELSSILHILTELEYRDIDNLNDDDREHIKNDIERAYEYLSFEWVVYMEHLQESYPYMFSSEIKMNPYCERS